MTESPPMPKAYTQLGIMRGIFYFNKCITVLTFRNALQPPWHGPKDPRGCLHFGFGIPDPLHCSLEQEKFSRTKKNRNFHEKLCTAQLNIEASRCCVLTQCSIQDPQKYFSNENQEVPQAFTNFRNVEQRLDKATEVNRLGRKRLRLEAFRRIRHLIIG